MLAVQNITINSAVIQKDILVWIVVKTSVEWPEETGRSSSVHQEDGGVGTVRFDCLERESEEWLTRT